MKNLLKILIPIIGLSFGSLESFSQKTGKIKRIEQIPNGIIGYNEEGQVIRKVLNNGGKTEINYEYDDKGQIKTEIYCYDANKDQKNDSTEIRQYTYNKKGKKIKEILFRDSDADGKNNNIETRTYKYAGGKLSKTEILYDNNADGKTDRVEKY